MSLPDIPPIPFRWPEGFVSQARVHSRFLLLATLSFAVGICAPVYGQSQSQIDGFTEPYRRAELASAEPGVVASVMVEEGDRVEAGQLVAQLENAALKAAAEVAQATAANTGRL